MRFLCGVKIVIINLFIAVLIRSIVALPASRMLMRSTEDEGALSREKGGKGEKLPPWAEAHGHGNQLHYIFLKDSLQFFRYILT